MTTNPMKDLLTAVTGKRIPGGCDQCDAYQTVQQHEDFHAVFLNVIHHDDDCPELARQNPDLTPPPSGFGHRR